VEGRWVSGGAGIGALEATAATAVATAVAAAGVAVAAAGAAVGRPDVEGEDTTMVVVMRAVREWQR
jgi:hypothetical protein